jgi:hypothetical protein
MHECDEAAEAAAICIPARHTIFLKKHFRSFGKLGGSRFTTVAPEALARLDRLRRRSRLAAKGCEGVTAQRGDQSRPCLLQRFHKCP